MLKIKKECDPHVSFVNKVQRKVIHILFKHYKCKSCGKSFSQAGNLKKHFVHDGRKLEILSHTTVCFCKVCEPLILEFSIFTCSLCVIYTIDILINFGAFEVAAVTNQNLNKIGHKPE